MKSDLNSDLSSYFNENLENPNYLYLGSSHEIDFEKLKEDNHDNDSFSMYLTSYYYAAIANAFAEKLAEKNQGREYHMSINNHSIPILNASDVLDLNDKDQGYLYIFECPEDAKSIGNYNFKIDEFISPVKVKELFYGDHKMYFNVISSKTRTK